MLPVAIALFIIYRKDNKQPEPPGKLFKAFFYGIISAPLSFLLSDPFTEMGLSNDQSTTVLGQIANAFFGAAIPEEFFKLLMLWLAVRKNPYFDEHLDGIVYAVCVGMGFAAIENVMYLFDNYDEWVSVGIGRAFFSIPGHFFFAILMGYFYSLAHFCHSFFKKNKYMMLAFVAPVLAHGIYDSLLMVQDVLPEIAGFLTIGVIYFLNRLRKKTNTHIDHLRRKDEYGA